MTEHKELKTWLLVVGVLAILGVSAFLIVDAIRNTADALRETTQQSLDEALQPVNDVADMTGGLATQVSEFLNPTPTILPDPVTIIRDVRTLARLETIQYSVEKVVTAEQGIGTLEFLFGDQLIFVAHGVVIAGIDLAHLPMDDLWLESGVLYVRLPEPQIFVATLDNDKSYVYDRETGLFTKGSANLETAARRTAEDEIVQAAIEDGILDQARINAEYFLLRLFNSLGYEDVIFVGDQAEGD
jgi:hypothetical protein